MKRRLLLAICATAFAFMLVPAFADDDAHYIQADDYFIAKEVLKQGYINVFIAKMKTPATAQTKNEAEFLKVADGGDMWTKIYWLTRIAAKDELKIGLLVIALDVAGEEDVYRAPESKDEARTAPWFMAKITDVSDMYKGYVTVSGGYKVSVAAIRVIVDKK